MTQRELILHNLLTVKYATINNLYSPTAKTANNSTLQASVYFKEFLNNGLVAPIKADESPRNVRREVFYQITKKGAENIDRPEDYKYVEMKASF